MNVQQNFELRNSLWYKIGGKAKYYLQAKNKNDIYEALDFIEKNNVDKIFVCGMGSNLIFSDDFFNGAVLQITTDSPTSHSTADYQFGAFAGEPLGNLIKYSLFHGAIGLEWAGGLPGTLGAAIRGNVGAYGHEVKETVSSAEVLVLKENGSFDLKTMTNQELNFVYRGSEIKNHKGKMIVLSALFNLTRSENSEILEAAKKTYEEKIAHRKSRHPLEFPNCGSVFKNIRDPKQVKIMVEKFPEIKELVETKWYGKVSAAYFIDKFGLKGYRIGDAQISEKHALFIVNLGNAKAKDVLNIINTVQSKFQETFGFMLEPEVEIVN